MDASGPLTTADAAITLFLLLIQWSRLENMHMWSPGQKISFPRPVSRSSLLELLDSLDAPVLLSIIEILNLFICMLLTCIGTQSWAVPRTSEVAPRDLKEDSRLI